MAAKRPADEPDRPLNLEQEVHVEWDSTIIPRVTRTGEALRNLADGVRKRSAPPKRELLNEKFEDFGG